MFSYLLPLHNCFYCLEPSEIRAIGRPIFRDETEIVLHQGLSKLLLSFVQGKNTSLSPRFIHSTYARETEAQDLGVTSSHPSCFRLQKSYIIMGTVLSPIH